jgi:Zn finger protein HypA/HybF involved in hydrogenase expression
MTPLEYMREKLKGCSTDIDLVVGTEKVQVECGQFTKEDLKNEPKYCKYCPQCKSIIKTAVDVMRMHLDALAPFVAFDAPYQLSLKEAIKEVKAVLG